MTEKQKQELNQARLNEFFGVQTHEDELRKSVREMGKQLQLIQEEMGLSRSEAINFMATMFGTSIRNNLGGQGE